MSDPNIDSLLSQLKRLMLHPEKHLYTRAVKKDKEILYPHQKDFLGDRIILDALSSDRPIGIMLAQSQTGLTKAGCIDLDCPRDAVDLPAAYQLALNLKQAAIGLGVQAEIEYSGNRGYHVWVFSDQPILWSTMLLCLKAIAHKAKFSATEYFPERYPEAKCIKLPGVINLKSGNRSGFVDGVYNPLEPTKLPIQDVLLATFKQTPLEAILAACKLGNKNPTTFESNSDLNKLEGKIPGCINHLTQKGAPQDLEYNCSNLTLARYALGVGLTENEAVKLAVLMANNSQLHPTSKVSVEAKVSNFKSVYQSASRNPSQYAWGCGYALSGIGDRPISERGCSTDCPLFQSKKSTDKPSNSSISFNALIISALTNLTQNGVDVCLSALLLEGENLLANDFKPPYQKLSEGEELKEFEALAYLLQNPAQSELNIPPESFSSGSGHSLKEYLKLLISYQLPNSDILKCYLEELKARGLKKVTSSKLGVLKADLKKPEIKLETALDSLTKMAETIQAKTSDQGFMNDYSQGFIEELFAQPKEHIKTFCPSLNDALNGGLTPGKLYVIAGIPGCGKSTLAHSLADEIAGNQIPVIYAAFEMSRAQLFIYSMSRLCQLNSRVIERRGWLSNPDLEPVQLRLLKTGLNYHSSIGNYLKIIEADDIYTAAKLKALITKTRGELELQKSDPVVVIIDYLQLMLCGDEKIDSSTNETLRVSKIVVQLKRLARDSNCVVWAISDITKASYEKALGTGSLDLSALRDSFKIAHAADCILLLQSNSTGKSDQTKSDQVDHCLNNLGRSDLKTIIKNDFPLNQSTNDIYSRLSILKNRGGINCDLLYVYRKALHTFKPINLFETYLKGENQNDNNDDVI